MTAVAAWSSQPVDPRSCKPRPPFGVQSWVEASGSWVVRVANPGIARDLVVTAWSETTAPAIVWQGRMAPDESRTLTIGAPPAGANRLSAAVEPLLDTPAASGSGGTAGGDAHAPPILRSISVLERQPHGAAAGAPEPELRIDPDTGERVLDLPGTLGTAP